MFDLTYLTVAFTYYSDEEEFISDLGVSDVLELPPAFGNIYLGEKFTSYLSINNDSVITVDDVAFKAELQTSSQRYVYQ